MRSRHLWFIAVVALGVALGFWWSRRTPLPATPGTAPAAAKPATPPPEVKIEDRKTIDFSHGKPVVKQTAADQAAMDKAVKEMNDATKDITFGPSSPPAKTPPPAPSK